MKDVTDTDIKWMSLALGEAAKARAIDEVPVGACIVSETGDLIAAGYNRTITDCDPTAHAEIVALRAAAKILGNYRLTSTTVYTTIEPCAMCAGALVNARITRLVYGSDDERFGAIKTHFNIGLTGELNHQIDVESGVLADECRSLMQEFFKAKRALT
jgi:tRNA(adenine34) deaminase